MSIHEGIFHAYDIRGTVDELSDDLARRVGAAVVEFTKARRVVVGRDMRATSPDFARAVIEGIRSQGADVIDIGMCSTPIFNFAVAAFAEHEAGVMVTASHNPAEYNGFKMSRGDGLPISGEEIKPVVLGWNGKVADRFGSVRFVEMARPYLKRVAELANVPSLTKTKVVIDAGNGMGGMILSRLFVSLDCEMIPMYFDPDGRFPNHEANPIKLETLKELQAKVAEVHADIGIALDGDADRVGFMDETGRFVNGDLLLAVLVEDRLREHHGKGIVYSPNASWAVRDAIARSGGVPLLEKVGRSNIICRMAKEGAAFGGEVSAHYFYPEFFNMESTDFTILLILKLLKESGKKASEWLAPCRMYAQSGEINFSVRDKEAVLAGLEKKYGPAATSVNKLDGLRAEFKDWWFNVRKSNTEPLVRLNMEAISPALMEEKRDELSLAIRGDMISSP